MLTIQFNEVEYYDDDKEEFISYPQKIVSFEFTLKAVYEWEAKYKVPFLSSGLTGMAFELLDFYLMMSKDKTLTIDYLTEPFAEVLWNYIQDGETATTFSQNGNKVKGSGKVYTSEELYALMFLNGIPIDFEDRNLNRLLIILRIISVYSSPPEKMSQQDILAQNTRLNAERKAKYNTEG